MCSADLQGVGDVGRLGQAAQAAGGLDRPLHLELGGVPVAGEVLLDLGAGQAADRHTRLGRRQDHHPPRVGHQNARPRVLVVGVKLLDGHHKPGKGQRPPEKKYPPVCQPFSYLHTIKIAKIDNSLRWRSFSSFH